MDVGNDLIEHTIQVRISGLTPATEYHYRVVATSDWGTGTGIDLTFTTRSVP
jgi:phosphodiesterase/alkaline phosphatase D-like protein